MAFLRENIRTSPSSGQATTTSLLRHRILNACHSRAAFSNPRTTNGLRNVGAVQAQVPGPLPLLGVAGAYGWCRRLRRRIRAQRAPQPGRIVD